MIVVFRKKYLKNLEWGKVVQKGQKINDIYIFLLFIYCFILFAFLLIFVPFNHFENISMIFFKLLDLKKWYKKIRKSGKNSAHSSNL